MAINQQVNKNITQEEYFNNNGRGFNLPDVIKIDDLNIKVEVYSHNLRAGKVAKIESEIRETSANFKDAFGLKRGDSEQTLKVYVFDDKADYTYLGGSERFGSYLGDEGGKAYYRGNADVFAEMYVYQQGGVHNLQHEFAHGLTYLATGGERLPTVLMEGIADYFEHHSDHKFNAQGSSIDRTEAANLDLSRILNLQYSSNGEENSLVYKTGHALIMYLQEKDPSLLKNYLDALRKGDSHESKGFLDEIKGHNDNFKGWLASNNTETVMEDINALQVTKGDFIATGQEIVGGEIKNVFYYKANIEKLDGENVGNFSPVEHVAFYDVARTINRATNDMLDISKKYHFLKVIKTPDGQVKLTYSDQQGNEYQNSQEYKMQAFRMLLKYDENLKKTYDERLKNLDEQIRKESDEVLEKYHKQEISYEELLKKYNFITSSSRYGELKNSLLDEMISTGSKQLKAAKSIDVEKILEELVNINPNLIRDTNKDIDVEKVLIEGKIFSMQAHGHGDMGALSIYDGNKKLGELLSESGFFKQLEGQTKETFVFEDILNNLNVQYDGGAYMAITKENGHYKASLIDGRTVERDEYFDEAHLHENELLHPSTGHIQKDLDSLLLRGTKILSHQDSDYAQYSDEQRKNGVIVEKGRLLDNKGTDRADDDVYEAIAKQGSENLYAFKNMGFYITEEVKNERGEVTNGSNLFIHDHGKNVRYQLPENITHLKLVEKDGQYKLAPSDSKGKEYNGIPDEYKYIDPVFAHEYEKRDYSHKHVNIGLIDFNKYGTGKLFAIKHDPNDYHIQRNSNGEIVRIKDQTYLTKVKLFDGDKEIGMLSNNFHNFKGKIFFSADYNYSYNDFLASVSPQVEIEDMGNGSKKITFDQGNGDIGDTNRGYTDHQRIYTREKQTESPQASETQTGVDTLHMSHSKVVEQPAGGQAELGVNRESDMQSDQPTPLQSLARTKRAAFVEEKEQEQIVLKDTILKIEKGYDRDSEGKHKANVIIDYNDIKALYDRAEGVEKQSVLKFWHKLAESEYKVGVLPEDKYYFEKGKFVVHNSDTKKLIMLPEDKVSIKIMKDGDSYSLAIPNDSGEVISSISKIDNQNYELLSDTSHFNLGEQDNIGLPDQHHEYNLYLENGLVKMFDCTSDHIYHDHNLT